MSADKKRTLTFARGRGDQLLFGGGATLFGLIFITIGILSPSSPKFPRPDETSALGALILGVLIFAFGQWILSAIVSCDLDLETRTYRIKRGIIPGFRVEHGSFEEFDHLEFLHGTYPAAVYKFFENALPKNSRWRIQSDPDQPYWRVELVWKEQKRKNLALLERSPGEFKNFGRDHRRDARDAGAELAARLGLPFVDRSAGASL